MDINDRIASLILTLNMNPSAFSENIGVKSTVIYNIIKGRRNKPSYDVIRKIAETYHVNTNWLLLGGGKQFESKVTEDPEAKLFNLQSRILYLLENISTEYPSNPMIIELNELIHTLIEDNSISQSKLVLSYEKNEKMMDLLRKKLSLDI